jgi:hypothetical protein
VIKTSFDNIFININYNLLSLIIVKKKKKGCKIFTALILLVLICMRCHNYTCIEVKWRFTVYTIQVLRVFNLLLLPDILNKDIQNSTHSPPNF